MKRKLSYAIATVSVLAIASGAVIPASAAETEAENIKVYCYSVNPSANAENICSTLNSVELQNYLEQYGCNSDNVENIIPPSVDSNLGNDVKPDSGNNSENQAPDNEITEDQNESNISEYERRVAEIVNEIRVENGLSPLTLSSELSAVARAKSQDMKDNKYFSHTSPVYGSPFDMLKSFGISYRTAGENIAMGQPTPEVVVDGWMNSEGHRANILNSSYTQIGVGYVAEGNYWTQMFIG